MKRRNHHYLWSLVLLGLSVGTVQAEQKSLTCTVRCSETQLRTGIAEIVWTKGADAAAAAAKSLPPQLDVTVFHNGFNRGLYRSFGAISEGTTPKAITGAPPDAHLEERTRRAFDLKLRVPEKSRVLEKTAAGTTVVERFEIENLEPGMLYRFRVHNDGQGTQEVECEAPVCPADMKEGR